VKKRKIIGCVDEHGELHQGIPVFCRTKIHSPEAAVNILRKDRAHIINGV